MMFFDFPTLFAEAAAGAAPSGSGSPPMLMFLVVMMAGLYFIVLLPGQRAEKKRRLMIDSLKKNDRVLTSGGIYGTVVSVDAEGDKVIVRVDDSVKLTFSRAGISRVIEPVDKEKEKEKEKDKATT